jgi:hypothetical protein
MALDPRKPFYRRRWFLAVIILSGALGGTVAEFGWRRGTRIADPVALQWIKSSPFVRNYVGEIRTISVSRTWSEVDFGIIGETTGRTHYLVHGSKDDLDLLVSWRSRSSDGTPAVVKVQWIDTKGFDTIWP